MIRRRVHPDGLPARVYERKGVRVYSIGYKLANGAWAFRFQCDVTDVASVCSGSFKHTLFLRRDGTARGLGSNAFLQVKDA